MCLDASLRLRCDLISRADTLREFCPVTVSAILPMLLYAIEMQLVILLVSVLLPHAATMLIDEPPKCAGLPSHALEPRPAGQRIP